LAVKLSFYVCEVKIFYGSCFLTHLFPEAGFSGRLNTAAFPADTKPLAKLRLLEMNVTPMILRRKRSGIVFSVFKVQIKKKGERISYENETLIGLHRHFNMYFILFAPGEERCGILSIPEQWR